MLSTILSKLQLDLFSLIPVFLTVFLIAAIYQWTCRSKPVGLPPGPRGLPLVGSFLDFRGRDKRDVLREYRKQYGDIYSYTVFNRLVIVINGYNNLKDFFVTNGELVSDRPVLPLRSLVDPEYVPGVVFASGQVWKDNRRFCLRNLRNFGMGKNLMQQRIHEEIGHFIEWIDYQDEKPFDMINIASAGTGNVISAMIFGKRFEYDDGKFKDVLLNLSRGISSRSNVLTSIPMLRFIPGDPFKVRDGMEIGRRFNEFLKEQIAIRRSGYEPGVVDDIVSAYLDQWEHEDTKDPNSHSSDAELKRLTSNLFAAGTETSSSTLRWFFLYMLRHPDIQAMIHKEIDAYVPTTRLPNLDDRTNLPKLEAAMLETQRICDLIPLALPHKSSQLFQFKGYDIPAEAFLLPNLTSVHQDDDIYPEPNEFRPDRFLDESKKVIKREEHVPFSLGRRICLGESLARAELFLFASAVLQRYHLLPPEGCDPPDPNGSLGIAFVPNEYQMRALRRF